MHHRRRVGIISSSLSPVGGGIERALQIFSEGLMGLGYGVVPIETGGQKFLTQEKFNSVWEKACEMYGTPDVIIAQSWTFKALAFLHKITTKIPIVLRWDGAVGVNVAPSHYKGKIIAEFACSHGAAAFRKDLTGQPCETIYNGVFSHLGSDGPYSDSERFQCVRTSRDHPWKQLKHVSALADMCENHDFIIAGCSGKNTANLTYAGVKQPSQLFSDVYAGSHIALCTSKPNDEGIPNSVIEPMSIGAVPVVYDTGEIRELVFDGWNGYVVKNGDVRALAERIDKLSMDRELWARMSGRSIDVVAQKFNTETAVEKLEALLCRAW